MPCGKLQTNPCHRGTRRVEFPQGVNFLIKQVDSQRHFSAAWKQVDDRTTHGKLACLVNRVAVTVSGLLQTLAELIDHQALAGPELDIAAQCMASGRQSLHQGGYWYQ